MTSDVLVMGGGATGQLAAAYLGKRFPQLRVAVVEGPHKHRHYFKPDIDNPADRTYVVDEIPTAPQILSFQINRFTRIRNRKLAPPPGLASPVCCTRG